MSARCPNKLEQLDQGLDLVAGLRKHFADRTIILVGKTFTGPELVEIVLGRLDAIHLTTAYRTAWSEALEAEREVLRSSKPLLCAIRKLIQTVFTKADDLQDFGLERPKGPVIRREIIRAAARKAMATKGARRPRGERRRTTKELAGDPEDDACPRTLRSAL
jgi:hypothetical protein